MFVQKDCTKTGGVESIGYEIADSLLSKGLQMAYLLDVNTDLVGKAIQNLTNKHGDQRVYYAKCDITRTTDLPMITKRMFNAFNVDILINNANLITGNDTKRIIDCNVATSIEWGLAFWEHMRRDKGGLGGTIVNLASIYDFKVNQYLPVYQATKYAVNGFSKCLGHRSTFERTGVSVLALCPGFLDTKHDKELKVWKQKQTAEFQRHAASLSCHKPGIIGDSALEVYRKAPTGTAWQIMNSKPTPKLLYV